MIYTSYILNIFAYICLCLKGVDPDLAFSSVPYEKGAAFLWYLEQLVGGMEVFEPFLRAYYEEFMFKSINSSQFKVTNSNILYTE